MPIKPDTQEKKEYKLVPEGTHLATCYSIIHIGHIPNTYPGAEIPTINKIRLTWELPEEMTVFKEGEEPRPFSISQEYTLSMNEKANLRKAVESWLGMKFNDETAAQFDAESLVGKSCYITVVHITKDEKTFAVINGVMKLPGKTKPPEPVNPEKIINWENLTTETLEKLPSFIQEKMKSSLEYGRWVTQTTGKEYVYPKDQQEEIPF